MPEALLNGLSPLVFFLLIGMACLTSLLTASLGAGGGIMLLGVLAQVVPPQMIIPLHGVIQLGSNAGRAAMLPRHIDWKLILAFLPGALLGALVGSFVLVALSPPVMYLTIAGFILYLCWGPPLPRLVLGRWGPPLVGTITTFLTLFVGATGPLIGAFLKQMYQDRFRTVATFASLMSLQHICKILVFQQAGFELRPWLPLVAAMIASGAIGSWIGLRLLKRLQDKHFSKIFSWILTLLALRLIWQAIDPYGGS
ncbi:sulfite exporter TauE/SafE family protein [Billgrantia aerodenitrificans]|uniref:Probable membrane transporter protein n=1 Tax=Billgrantia aerodenitrificans TaxID=2733483 RepID=A0ABS9AN11_9GAMM|nr:sulfite exporter TauE/SafE family protein [Halomonas aerodenitrificans]MCE8023210.1 sulfite exporter TauE/SafE family protein [Halomonas aerodenitrificans]